MTKFIVVSQIKKYVILLLYDIWRHQSIKKAIWKVMRVVGGDIWRSCRRWRYRNISFTLSFSEQQSKDTENKKLVWIYNQTYFHVFIKNRNKEMKMHFKKWKLKMKIGNIFINQTGPYKALHSWAQLVSHCVCCMHTIVNTLLVLLFSTSTLSVSLSGLLTSLLLIAQCASLCTDKMNVSKTKLSWVVFFCKDFNAFNYLLFDMEE